MVDGHTVTEYAADKFRIVPIFGIEAVAQALNSSFITTFINKLEVISFLAIAIVVFDDIALYHTLWNSNTLFVVLKASKDLIGRTI